MPSFSEHVRISQERTGRTFRDLHEWMDGRGTRLRDIAARHDIRNAARLLPVVLGRFGEPGAQEFLRHLEDDYRSHVTVRFWWRLAAGLRRARAIGLLKTLARECSARGTA